MPEVTLTDVLRAITLLNARLDDIDDSLAEAITKLDELNLPSGEGFSTFES